LYDFSRVFAVEGATNRSGAAKIGHLSLPVDHWRCVVWPFVRYIIMKALNSFLMF